MNRATSLYLELARLTAALAVVVSHISYGRFSGGQLNFMNGAGVQAVDIFFVMSGFVIAYVCDTRETDALNYTISRAVRIYSVAIPAVILTAILDIIGIHANPALYDNIYQPLNRGLIARSVLFLGELWNAHRYPGTNSPYWSLGFEVWYYAAFGVFLFSPRRWRWVTALATLIFIGPKVTLLFPIWLMGVGCYHVCKTRKVSKSLGWVLLLTPICVLIGFEMTGPTSQQPFANLTWTSNRWISASHDYLLATLFTLHLIGFSAVSNVFLPALEKFARQIKWAAGATFSIYLMHLPIIVCLSAAMHLVPTATSTPVILIGLTLPLCFLFAELSERRKDVWSMRLRQMLRLNMPKPDRPSYR